MKIQSSHIIARALGKSFSCLKLNSLLEEVEDEEEKEEEVESHYRSSRKHYCDKGILVGFYSN